MLHWREEDRGQRERQQDIVDEAMPLMQPQQHGNQPDAVLRYPAHNLGFPEETVHVPLIQFLPPVPGDEGFIPTTMEELEDAAFRALANRQVRPPPPRSFVTPFGGVSRMPQTFFLCRRLYSHSHPFAPHSPGASRLGSMTQTLAPDASLK